MPHIKRYPNRKLYDTEAKCYVTLEDITEMIRADQDVHVTDHETGDDLTTLTLTQIILEQEKKASGFLPRSLLTSLIRTGGDTLEQVVRSLQVTLTLTGHGEDDGEVEEIQSSPGEVSFGATPDLEAGSSRNTAGSKVDDRVSDMFHLLNVPTRRDMRQLQKQLDMLSAKLAELASEPTLGQAQEIAMDESDTKKGDTEKDDTEARSESEQNTSGNKTVGIDS